MARELKDFISGQTIELVLANNVCNSKLRVVARSTEDFKALDAVASQYETMQGTTRIINSTLASETKPITYLGYLFRKYVLSYQDLSPVQAKG